uniref:Fatty acid binding protein 6 n=1 Tax=Salvator merianae TaxID=96440 RepID=A0A8D0BB98_SALMN
MGSASPAPPSPGTAAVAATAAIFSADASSSLSFTSSGGGSITAAFFARLGKGRRGHRLPWRASTLRLLGSYWKPGKSIKRQGTSNWPREGAFWRAGRGIEGRVTALCVDKDQKGQVNEKLFAYWWGEKDTPAYLTQGLPADAIEKGRHFKIVNEVTQNGDEFTWSQIYPGGKSITNKFVIGKESEMELVDSKKIKATMKMEGGKLVGAFPNFHYTAEIAGGKLVEVITLKFSLEYMLLKH